MTISQAIFARLWWGRLRRLFEGFLRRLFPRRQKILSGPLRGFFLEGGLAQILGIYELQVQKAITSELTPGKAFYDIGANNGFFTLLGARLTGDRGQVCAFEPFPPNVERLQRAVLYNRVSNVQVFAEAVSNVSGKAELSVGFSTATLSLINPQAQNTIDVPTITLDDFVSEHEAPDLIKVDVEGAEILVLQGAKWLLKSDRKPTWIIEIHSQENDLAVGALLQEHGYQIVNLSHPRSASSRYPVIVLATRNAR